MGEQSREQRIALYQAALGYNGGALLSTAAGIEEWLASNRLSAPAVVLPRLASLMRRLLRLADDVSAVRMPLDERLELTYDAQCGVDWLVATRNATTISMQHVAWGSPEIGDLLDELNGALENVLENSLRIAVACRVVESYEFFSGGYERIAAIGRFPFFLLDERRFGWDVLRYGTQTRVVLIMNQRAARAVFNMRVAPGATPTVDRDTLVRALGTIDKWGSKYRFVYYGVGHAAFKMLLALLDAREYAILRAHLDDLTTLAAPTTESAGLGRHPEAVSALLADNDDSSCYVLVTDPGEPQFLSLIQTKPKDLVVASLPHQLGIPVGVGFSLSALARLTVDLRVIGQLARATLAVIGGARTHAFEAVGVVVGPDEWHDLAALSQIREVTAPLPPTLGTKESALEALQTTIYEKLGALTDYLRESKQHAHVYEAWHSKQRARVQGCDDIDLLAEIRLILEEGENTVRKKDAIDALWDRRGRNVVADGVKNS